MRIDRVLLHHAGLNKSQARAALSAGRVTIDGVVTKAGDTDAPEFCRVELDRDCVYEKVARYVMLHKPIGYLSATSDPEQPTVMDLIDAPWKDELHLAGRLDKNTSGLVILTNDGKWSRHLSEPGSKIPKVYVVAAELAITPEMVEVWEAGMYFEKEQAEIAPAGVELLAEDKMRLTIYEGKHHQIKRMLLKVGNRVTGLHRESVGRYELDIAEGEWREFSP